jgi:NAD(P)H dehydrogenase (quinone)
MKEVFDSCGRQWVRGVFHGKFAGTFFSTSTQGAGQETTALSCVPFFVHHGINYVPIGYKFSKLSEMNELHGGSPWGAGTFAAFDNKRKPSAFELELAEFQGFEFGNLMKRVYCTH